MNDWVRQAVKIGQGITGVQGPTHCQTETWLEETIHGGGPLFQHVGLHILILEEFDNHKGSSRIEICPKQLDQAGMTDVTEDADLTQ
eukprot:Skav235230  [mRNA]  locus=scaffold3995:212172:212877:- [translate_table: standard]